MADSAALNPEEARIRIKTLIQGAFRCFADIPRAAIRHGAIPVSMAQVVRMIRLCSAG